MDSTRTTGMNNIMMMGKMVKTKMVQIPTITTMIRMMVKMETKIQ
jgi:hypothetical protein